MKMKKITAWFLCSCMVAALGACGQSKDPVLSIPDFVVKVPTGKDPVVLQLTDPQIIDAGQERYEDRLNEGGDIAWATDKVEENCYQYITETVAATNPDLIIITGDLVYGEFDDNGTALLGFIDFMESFQIPWAPVFGNHDNESAMGADWQCEQLENAKYCLFEQKELTGNGNYSVGIAQGGKLKRVFYMLDSNGCGNASSASMANGHTKTGTGFESDQIDWFTLEIKEIKELAPEVKISFAYHIQQRVFLHAYEQYGFTSFNTQENPINIDTHPNRKEGDFGYLGRDMKGPWDGGYLIWDLMKELGTDSVFVGHEHCNNASVVYDGVRFQYGQKSSTYDRYNCILEDGTVSTSGGTPLIGGTVIPISEADGSILTPHIYLCKNAGGNIDWSQWE